MGLVSFLEDTAFFTSTPVSGFSFRSPYGPSGVNFKATTLSLANGTIYTVSGPTQAPVPEPGYFGLLAVTLAFGILSRLKRTTVS